MRIQQENHSSASQREDTRKKLRPIFGAIGNNIDIEAAADKKKKHGEISVSSMWLGLCKFGILGDRV